MSNEVLPHYIGQKITVERRPVWSTRKAWAVSGKRRAVQERAYPLWEIELSIEALREKASDGSALNEPQNMTGFYNRHGGGFDSFLYTDPDDNAVTDFQFGVRDGVTTQFQLLRSIGFGGYAFLEPVQNVNVLGNIKSNGVAITSPTDYTISATGLVTLAAPGTNGHALTWTGSYYWRVCFKDDELPFRRIYKGIWELDKLRLTGSVMNKVGP